MRKRFIAGLFLLHVLASIVMAWPFPENTALSVAVGRVYESIGLFQWRRMFSNPPRVSTIHQFVVRFEDGEPGVLASPDWRAMSGVERFFKGPQVWLDFQLNYHAWQRRLKMTMITALAEKMKTEGRPIKQIEFWTERRKIPNPKDQYISQTQFLEGGREPIRKLEVVYDVRANRFIKPIP